MIWWIASEIAVALFILAMVALAQWLLHERMVTLRGAVFTPGEEWTIQGKQWVVVEVQWTNAGYITTRWQEKDKRRRWVEDLNDEVDW